MNIRWPKIFFLLGEYLADEAEYPSPASSDYRSATGYIGGATLAYLLSSPSTNAFAYSALVRSKDKASLLASLGIQPVVGTLDDAAILSAEAEKADVVIHTANSADHMPSCEAILEGMKKRSDNPILIIIVSD